LLQDAGVADEFRVKEFDGGEEVGGWTGFPRGRVLEMRVVAKGASKVGLTLRSFSRLSDGAQDDNALSSVQSGSLQNCRSYEGEEQEE
jgi:hypothetical protein